MNERDDAAALAAALGTAYDTGWRDHESGVGYCRLESVRNLTAVPVPLRAAIREVLVTWERYFASESDEARRAYWSPLARAMDGLNAQGFDLAMQPFAALPAHPPAPLPLDVEALAETLYRYYPGPSREDDWSFWQTRARNMLAAMAEHRVRLATPEPTEDGG